MSPLSSGEVGDGADQGFGPDWLGEMGLEAGGEGVGAILDA